MTMQWISSSASLPHAGTPIQFMLDDRKVPIEGTYVGGTFRSRWCTYDVGCVNSWRVSNLSAQPAATVVIPALDTASRSTVNWLSALLARPRVAVAVPGGLKG